MTMMRASSIRLIVPFVGVLLSIGTQNSVARASTTAAVPAVNTAAGLGLKGYDPYLHNGYVGQSLWSLNKSGNIASADHNWPEYRKKDLGQ
jgi:hypothetical protein